MDSSPPVRAAVSSSRRRSLVGLIVALLVLPFILGIDSCFLLKTPIGDPEQGWADPRISGVWLAEEKNDKPSDFAAWMWVFEPYDSRTWLVTWVMFEDAGKPASTANQGSSPPTEQSTPAAEGQSPAVPPPRSELTPADVLRIAETLGDERAQPARFAIFKGWLTTLGGRRFLVLEPKAAPSSTRGFRPKFWYVFRADLQDGRLLLFGLDADTEKLDEATTRAHAEAIIARHASDPKFTELAFTLHPVPRSAHDQAGKALERVFNFK